MANKEMKLQSLPDDLQELVQGYADEMYDAGAVWRDGEVSPARTIRESDSHTKSALSSLEQIRAICQRKKLDYASVVRLGDRIAERKEEAEPRRL